jgi:alpha/beta hydrolase fold
MRCRRSRSSTTGEPLNEPGRQHHVLEEAAQAFADATANPPFLYDLAPEKGREVVNQTQAGEIAKPNVTDEWIKVPGGPRGDVDVRIVRPAGATGTLPVILYPHGAAWVFGNAGTHDRLVRELAVGANAAAIFPAYSLSPEAKYPVALEECYAVGAMGRGRGPRQGPRHVADGDRRGFMRRQPRRGRHTARQGARRHHVRGSSSALPGDRRELR